MKQTANAGAIMQEGDAGLTLVELLVVLVILGLIATVGGIQVVGYLQRARADTEGRSWHISSKDASVGGTVTAWSVRRRSARGQAGRRHEAYPTGCGNSESSCTWRTSIVSPSEAGQREAHSMASSLEFTLIVQ